MKKNYNKTNKIKFSICIVLMVVVGAVLVPLMNNDIDYSAEVAKKPKNTVNLDDKVKKDQDKNQEELLKGIWISYLEFEHMPKDEIGFKTEVDKMFDRCKELGFNSVIVQVRPDSDAMYQSAYFPWSKFASGEQGVDPGYDPTAYMIDAAHKRELEFHAWINPYRVTGYLMSFKEVVDSNPAKAWLYDRDKTNDRWALLHDKFIYYNPAIPEVRELIINGVREIVTNYDIDGIHFDDYFYPTVDDNNSNLSFDKKEYEASNSELSLPEWRRENVNMLVRDTYAAIKAIKKDVVFGISPMGNTEYLANDQTAFVDIEKWMSEPGYVDYIMPQLYWGFERRESNGEIATYAYENNLNTWVNLKKTGDVDLMIGLNLDNAGKDIEDGNKLSEWSSRDDILKRQIEKALETNEVSGYCFFRYDIFQEDSAQNEMYNFLPLLKE